MANNCQHRSEHHAALNTTPPAPADHLSPTPQKTNHAEANGEVGFDRGFLALALHLNRRRLMSLQNLREHHHSDLDQAQIASALMTVTVGAGLLRSDEALRRLRKDGLPDPALGPWPKRSQRIRELVAATGLPRETIRRKLHQMEAQGEVERDATGGWLWAMGQAPENREVYRQEMRQLLVGVEQLRELLASAQELVGP